MRLQNNAVTLHRAPATRVSLARFQEVDGPFIFGTPSALKHLVPRLVHLQEAAGLQNGVHSEIFAPNVAITVLMIGKITKICEWN
jgi:hypothetical protein